MLNAIGYSISDQAQVDVVPWHATSLEYRDLVGDVIVDLLEVHHTTVVVVLTWENGSSEVRGVTVGERASRICVKWNHYKRGVGGLLRMGVPSSEAEVQTPNAGTVTVNNEKFLMMGPNLDGIYRTNMIGVALTTEWVRE